MKTTFRGVGVAITVICAFFALCTVARAAMATVLLSNLFVLNSADLNNVVSCGENSKGNGDLKFFS